MAYSITPILHHYADKKGLHKVLIQVIYNRKKAYASTDYKLTSDQFKDGKVINHPHKQRINAGILNKCADISGRLLKLLDTKEPTINDLKLLVQGKTGAILFADFVDEYLSTAGIKASTKEMYNSIKNVVCEYNANVTLDSMNVEWLRKFESNQRKLKKHNTVHKIMKKTKTLLYEAADQDKVDSKIFEKYMPPAYIQPIPEYLDEQEIKAFKRECDTIANDTKKLCGYYFLLSCYAGFRLDDAINFNYKARVRDGKIIVSTKKKDKIVSMPVHSRLAEVLDYIKDKTLNISESHIREYVYDIAKIAGVERKIKFHTSRHTFAMLLMDNGFSIEEVAELLGNDLESARIYARISNKRLEKKVIDRLG